MQTVSQILSTVLVLAGAATAYGGPAHAGKPLYCDRGNGLIFDQVTQPFVALDVGLYETGQVRCGDLIRVTFPSGEMLEAQALDAGYLDGYCVDDLHAWIVVDVPLQFAPFEGLSALATVRNLSAFRRAAYEVIAQ